MAMVHRAAPCPAGAGRTPYCRRIPATLPAIHASPRGDGCRPSRAREPPSRRERVHDDHLGVRGLRPGHDRLVGPVDGGRPRAPGEDGEQRDLRLRRLGLDRGHRLLDAVLLQARRHRHVVVAGLHDHQRRPERAQVGPGDLGGDRSLPAEAGVHVAGPGNPVHEGVPAQLAGQQHGPGPGRILRPHPGGERRADDRDRGHAGPPAWLKPLLTPGQRRGLALIYRDRPGRSGGRRTGGWRAGRRVDGRLGGGDQQQYEKADCGGGRQPPGTSPGHGQFRRCRRPCQTAG